MARVSFKDVSNMNSTNKIACKICMAEKGLTLNSTYLFDTQDELNTHLEAIHHKPVIQKGESEDEAIKRFLEKYPEAKECEQCNDAGAKWMQLR